MPEGRPTSRQILSPTEIRANIQPMELIGSILPYVQVGLSIILIGLVLLQQNDASLGTAFGGGESAGSFHKKRGLEKTFFTATIIVAILFVGSAVLALFI